jgi:hypothetical protein
MLSVFSTLLEAKNDQTQRKLAQCETTSVREASKNRIIKKVLCHTKPKPSFPFQQRNFPPGTSAMGNKQNGKKGNQYD